MPKNVTLSPSALVGLINRISPAVSDHMEKKTLSFPLLPQANMEAGVFLLWLLSVVFPLMQQSWECPQAILGAKKELSREYIWFGFNEIYLCNSYNILRQWHESCSGKVASQNSNAHSTNHSASWHKVSGPKTTSWYQYFPQCQVPDYVGYGEKASIKVQGARAGL